MRADLQVLHGCLCYTSKKKKNQTYVVVILSSKVSFLKKAVNYIKNIIVHSFFLCHQKLLLLVLGDIISLLITFYKQLIRSTFISDVLASCS